MLNAALKQSLWILVLPQNGHGSSFTSLMFQAPQCLPTQWPAKILNAFRQSALGSPPNCHQISLTPGGSKPKKRALLTIRLAVAPPPRTQSPTADTQIQGHPAGQRGERPADPRGPENRQDRGCGTDRRTGQQRTGGHVAEHSTIGEHCTHAVG